MDMKDFGNSTPNKFLVVLGKMNSTLMEKLEVHIKSLGFNHSEFLVMYAIAVHGQLTIQDIAARIFVTSGNMTYTIDKLEKKDMLKRIPCPEDRRRIFIDFTDQGREIWYGMLEDHSKYLDDMFNGLDEDMVKQTIEAMKVIGKHVGS